jgi:hypothetical protein
MLETVDFFAGFGHGDGGGHRQRLDDEIRH